ncbi:MAG TPA: hypothetical protein DDW92_01320, partial [Candidatus Veblenbacteria bacterium]|nr:hypothetical protein [Candidatus Veblenbacteria bacterium]
MDILGWPKFKGYGWLIIFALIAFFIYASFNWGLPWRFNSPDEAANAYFTQMVARGESVAVSEPLNYVAQNPIVHPRSTHIINGQLAPASFLGLPLLLGFVGRIIGE